MRILTELTLHHWDPRIQVFGNKHFYFIMQTATYELYYLPKGAENVIYPWQIDHTVCVKSKSNTIFSS